MQNTTEKNAAANAAGEYTFIQPKNEMLIGSPQEAPNVAQAFSPQADAKNDKDSINTSAWD